jgi:hypothetical protein
MLCTSRLSVNDTCIGIGDGNVEVEVLYQEGEGFEVGFEWVATAEDRAWPEKSLVDSGGSQRL